MANLDGCQIPCLPRMSEGRQAADAQPIIRRLKRTLAVPWNYYVKKWLKRSYHMLAERGGASSRQAQTAREYAPAVPLQAGDRVRVRSREDIAATLNPFKELRGCAFLDGMERYCGTEQRVFRVMQRFLDERDYKVKRVRGVILLKDVICEGTAAFGACDRCCLLFWREEWLEKVPGGG